MRNIFDVIRQKENDMLQLQKEVEALKLAARLLTEDVKIEMDPPRPIRSTPSSPPVKTDGEIVMAPPLRQFP